MFDTLSRSQQGDLGEARAVYELVKLGYALSKPLHVHLPYDFIAEKDNKLYRVQVKTSRLVLRKSTQVYQVQLCSTGGNRLVNTRTHFDPTKIDLLFVMTADDRCWLIPAANIKSKNNINVGTALYAEFQVSGNVRVTLPPESLEREERIDKREKVPPFTKDELEALLNEHPTVEIGRMFSMSDNGVARWAKKWNISKPPRGYWQKKQVGKV